MSDTSSPSCPSFPSCPDGLLLVDKPRGVTSFDAVAAVRGALHTKKVGHAGTLDPMATGLLVIAFGRATRLLQYIVEHDKTYEATIRLGARTTTDDAEGDLLVAHVVPWRTDTGDRREPVSRETPSAARSSASVPASVAMPSPERIETVIAERFTGDIEQVPNTFSAIKIGGRRAYDLAREGKDVELKARPVRIGEFTVLGVRRGFASVASTTSPLIAETAPAAASSSGVSPVSPDGSPDASTGVPSDALPHDGVIPVIDVDVRVSCSSGTYIRALARDLGEALGVGGYLTRLRRTRVGRFALPDDRSGLAAVTAMPADTDVAGEGRIRVIGAHAEPKTFTNRDGETITRNRCVLDTPNGLSGEARGGWLRACAIGMADAARGAMPVVVITADEARELRFGRRIERELDKGVHYAAIVPAEGADVATGMGAGAGADVAAIIERANRTQAKPVVVFPAE